MTHMKSYNYSCEILTKRMQVIQKNISSLSFNKRCLFNLFLGSLSALSFAPLNFIFILFITIPFYILNFDFFFLKKKRNCFFFVYNLCIYLSFKIGFHLICHGCDLLQSISMRSPVIIPASIKRSLAATTLCLFANRTHCV